MQTLIYYIGGHLMGMQVADAGDTLSLLPSFTPFQVDHADNPYPLDNCLCHIHTGVKIVIPETTMTDRMEREDIVSQVFVVNGFTYLLATRGQDQYKLKANHNWTTITTDLSFRDKNELAVIYHFIVTVYGMASAFHKTIKVHASVVEKQGKALLFIAPSGTGKSTHSRLWLRHVPGTTLLNDDEPIVRVTEDGSVRAFGAPWSGSTPCYKNISAKVSGIVLLRQSPKNELQKLGMVDAAAVLLKQVSVFRSDGDHKRMIADSVLDIISKIPVYRLDCRPDREAVLLTEPLIQNG